jgi:hypothetical protein
MDTILGAVIGIGALTIGGIFRLSYQQGDFHGLSAVQANALAVSPAVA